MAHPMQHYGVQHEMLLHTDTTKPEMVALVENGKMFWEGTAAEYSKLVRVIRTTEALMTMKEWQDFDNNYEDLPWEQVEEADGSL